MRKSKIISNRKDNPNMVKAALLMTAAATKNQFKKNSCPRLALGQLTLAGNYFPRRVRLPRRYIGLQNDLANFEAQNKQLIYQPDLDALTAFEHMCGYDEFKEEILKIDGLKLFRGIKKVRLLASSWRAGNGKILDTPDHLYQLNGEEMYQALMLALGYYVKNGDNFTLEHYPETYRADFDGANIYELCIGDGLKAAHTLSKLAEMGARPAHYLSADFLSLQDLLHGAAAELTKAGMPKINQSQISGDIFSEEFWNDLREKRKHIAPTGKRDVVLIRGATFNNFTEDQMHWLLDKIREAFPNVALYLSVDNTTKPRPLYNAYDTTEFRVWQLNGAYYTLSDLDPAIDPMKMWPKVEIFESKDMSRVYPTINFEEQAWFNYGKASMLLTKLQTEPITKPSEDWTKDLLKRRGWKEEGSMPYREITNDVCHNMYRCVQLTA